MTSIYQYVNILLLVYKDFSIRLIRKYFQIYYLYEFMQYLFVCVMNFYYTPSYVP